MASNLFLKGDVTGYLNQGNQLPGPKKRLFPSVFFAHLSLEVLSKKPQFFRCEDHALSLYNMSLLMNVYAIMVMKQCMYV